LRESDKNAKTYLKILERLEKVQAEKYYDKKVINSDWQKVFASINKKKSRLQTLYFIGRIAAAIIVVSGLSYLVINSFDNIDSNKKQYAENKIMAGSKKAILVLEDGKTVDLIKNEKNDIVQSGVVISINKKQLTYKVDGSTEKPTLAETYNTIVIPKAGEYSFTLADGTKVWVNSNTKLKYPVKFIGNKRLVYLEGEAYFEVTKDKNKPFIVKTYAGMEVEVLGTKFNIEAYKGNDNIKTTLLSGKVRVNKAKEESILKPNQQAVFDRMSGEIVKRDVDAYRYIAWKEGKFLFDNERLEDIMIKLSRWYNVEVFYMNQEVKDFHFTGDMERYSDIATILKLIEQSTNIRFRIKNNTIIISTK